MQDYIVSNLIWISIIELHKFLHHTPRESQIFLKIYIILFLCKILQDTSEQNLSNFQPALTQMQATVHIHMYVCGMYLYH